MFTTSGLLGNLLSARRLVIVPERILYQSSWRTPWRLSSLSVYFITVEYICQYQAKQRSASYNQCLWNDSHIFVCASLFLHIRLNIICLARFKVNIKTSFLMYSMGASASKRSPWQIWRYFTIIFLFLVLNFVDGIQLSLSTNYDSKINVHETKNVYISHLLPLSSPHISVNRLHLPF